MSVFCHLNLFPWRKQNNFQDVLAVLFFSPVPTVYYLHEPAIDLGLSLLYPL